VVQVKATAAVTPSRGAPFVLRELGATPVVDAESGRTIKAVLRMAEERRTT